MTDQRTPPSGQPSAVPQPDLAPRTVARGRVAVTSVFVLNGLVFASWVSRIPAVRDGLQLSTARVGLVLLAMSLGAVLALPSTGAVVPRLGPSATVRAGALVCTVGLTLAAVAAGVAGAAAPAREAGQDRERSQRGGCGGQGDQAVAVVLGQPHAGRQSGI